MNAEVVIIVMMKSGQNMAVVGDDYHWDPVFNMVTILQNNKKVATYRAADVTAIWKSGQIQPIKGEGQ